MKKLTGREGFLREFRKNTEKDKSVRSALGIEARRAGRAARILRSAL